MCDFLTLGLPEPAVAELAKVAEAHGLSLAPYSNPGLREAFSEPLMCCALTKGGCSCGLALGAQGVEQQARKLASRRKRYLRQGWSQAKIDRALKVLESGPGPGAMGLSAEVVAVLDRACEQAQRLALFWRSYSADVTDSPGARWPLQLINIDAVRGREINFAREVVYLIGVGPGLPC